MGNIYEPKYYQIDEIYIKEIIFENNSNSSELTIFGYYQNPLGNQLKDVDYGCDFSMLTDLLLFAEENGEPIINLISEKLSNPDEEDIDDDEPQPTIIDIENLLGQPLKIEGIVLTIYKPFEKNEEGDWIESKDEFYIIDKIEQKGKYGTSVKAIEYTIEKLGEHLILLDLAYNYYLHLVALGISVKEARKKASLKDELFFRIAILNHEVIINNKN